jgi:hypothetical protein
MFPTNCFEDAIDAHRYQGSGKATTFRDDNGVVGIDVYLPKFIFLPFDELL